MKTVLFVEMGLTKLKNALQLMNNCKVFGVGQVDILINKQTGVFMELLQQLKSMRVQLESCPSDKTNTNEFRNDFVFTILYNFYFFSP
jgi:hypothetical protein